MEVESFGIAGTVISIIIISVTILAQRSLCKKRVVDSQTQTSYTFVRTVYLQWKVPKVVPLHKWRLNWGTPEVWRFKSSDDPFHARPLLTAGQIRPTEDTPEAADFERIVRQVGGVQYLVNGPPADA